MTNKNREAIFNMSAADFRTAGHQLVEQLAGFLDTLPERRVAPETTTESVVKLLRPQTMPENGKEANSLLAETAELLFNNSTFNGHPNFMAYITSSAAPIGALGDFLAAAINANVGSWQLAPMATEIEKQTVCWIAELIGYPTNSAGLMLSGGNMANITAFWTARRAKATWDLRQHGLNHPDAHKMTVYASKTVHTWIDKAAELSGLGLDAVRQIPTNERFEMNTAVLRTKIEEDIAAGYLPFMVVGTAGTVSTGAVDPLSEIAAICREYGLWFHVDGAYGAFAAMLPESPDELHNLGLADSVALDPHKWLYAPLEAGCLLVKEPRRLVDTFSFHPDYYHFDEAESDKVNFYEYGPQNSRGFRALKVWLGLRQAGRQGYRQMLRDDIALARMLYDLVEADNQFEAFSHNLSITNFRYVPQDLPDDFPQREAYLNELNTAVMEKLRREGQAFISNAFIDGKFSLRACVVNFRTTAVEIERIPRLIAQYGKVLDTALRSQTMMTTV